MKQEKELPERKRNRLENYDYSSCGAYFITVCTLERRNFFWEKSEKMTGTLSQFPHDTQNIALSPCGKIADTAIRAIPDVYPSLVLESYVVMPNHIHMILRVRAKTVAPSMSQVVKQFKGVVSKQAGMGIWQKSFYDHVIRDRRDYEEHLKYIAENPMRWAYDELYAE